MTIDGAKQCDYLTAVDANTGWPLCTFWGQLLLVNFHNFLNSEIFNKRGYLRCIQSFFHFSSVKHVGIPVSEYDP